MITAFTQRAGMALIGAMLLASCSRPVAYFQHQPVDPYAAPKTQQLAIVAPVIDVAEPAKTVLEVQAAAPDEATVRNDSKLATAQPVNGRMMRVQNLLAATHGQVAPAETQAPRRMNLVERLIVKKMNRKISHQLAPNSPQKALISRGKLIVGIVLLIGGLAMLIAGTGTVAFIGLIVGLVGALAILVGLLGIDSY